MSGYSKIKFLGSTKSRSMDFSEPLSNFPQTPKPITKSSPNHPSKTEEITKQPKASNTHDPPSDLEGEDHVNGERFGAVLTRNSSVSSTTSSNRFRFDKKLGPTTSSLESAVKRVFSMRRSSSVSERYCRIHDQLVTIASPFHGAGEEGMDGYTVKARSMKNKKKNKYSAKILKACKRIFGF
ncbi:hypothetical protein RHGRI_014084 [Rhododendron griersonianum]|uniref:Uncharacterized protein n=1 Tax=Rhododendron griersonianum TaxID=479676 RepID=A0AAV6K8C6_9ERIC|nr:hypothetical protein RHGRI_014084 [Rhododendron griersonianum]